MNQEQTSVCQNHTEYVWLLSQIDNDKWPVLHNGDWLSKDAAIRMVNDYDICKDCPNCKECEYIDH